MFADNDPHRHILRTAQGVADAKQKRLLHETLPRTLPIVLPAPTCQYFGKRKTKCGKPTIEGYSYCKRHKARCYKGKPPRKDRIRGGGPRVYQSRNNKAYWGMG